MTETESFNKEKHFIKSVVKQCKCCLTCEHARRWGFDGRYSENPADLSAMCLHPDAPHESVRFGGSTERKYVSAFGCCDAYKFDKELS